MLVVVQRATRGGYLIMASLQTLRIPPLAKLILPPLLSIVVIFIIIVLMVHGGTPAMISKGG